MRRLLLAALIPAVAAVALVFAGAADDGEEDAYIVRAIFDNGSFLVEDEEVRVAGANIGVVEEVDVSMPGERVSYEPGKEYQPGKAVVVMRITDPAYQDFRQDASCILRPQSLIGERYVNCRLTRPTADGEPGAPPLERIPEGQPGAGQYLLPLENNGKIVDLDLINNIMRAPYAERLRLILNELGAGFGGRGEDIAELVERANPALREVNELLATLDEQRRSLERLTRDSYEILRPLARERRRVVRFFQGAGRAAAATAARRPQLEEALAKFPGFLAELEQTMGELAGFARSATPVTRDFGAAAPALTAATEALGPFAEGGRLALESLGEAGEEAGPKLAAADPIVRLTRRLARTGERPTRLLDEFLDSTRTGGGFERLMRLIYGFSGSLNLYDDAGHLMRTFLVPTHCVDHTTRQGDFGCLGTPTGQGRPPKLPRAVGRVGEAVAAGAESLQGDGTRAPGEAPSAPEAPTEPDEPPAADDPNEPDPTPQPEPSDPDGAGEAEAAGELDTRGATRRASAAAGEPDRPDVGAMRLLLDFLLAP
jgi:ABC-type transporter Mla subunit MlaD